MHRSPSGFKQLFWPLLILMAVLNGCAYYNTFYNAEQYFEEAQHVTRENQSETISREEINLYSKSIEKSKKLLQRYPKSKYRDDAQFLIAKSYYYKGDYMLAKRFFEDLALNYANSPHVKEVPLWTGRCLVKVGDLEMARYEASRILKGDEDRSLQADALLLMGEIAVEQDSLLRAENYLEQVIERSPDGFTKAQAQFQVGKMRENQRDYEGALEAYKFVSKFKPSESLKVEAIIRQTSMLKALNRDEDAIEMIGDMLESDKFVDIRGQLEVELGKLYLVTGNLDRAESKFLSILEDYSRQEVAAEASYYLGELQLTKKIDYKSAQEAYVGIKTQSVRSPFVNQGAIRIKQIERYITIQSEFVNLQRQLAGLKPIVKETKKADSGRGNRPSRSRGRGRGGATQDPAPESEEKNTSAQDQDPGSPGVVSAQDSLKFLSGMDENRYSLAEYLLFEFARVDTALMLLDSLERATADTNMQHQAAFMRYYAMENMLGDPEAGAGVMNHIKDAYPAYYVQINAATTPIRSKQDPSRDRYLAVATLFDMGNYGAAHAAYFEIYIDSTISDELRAKACFNSAWLNDHFLFDRETAMEAYQFMVSNFSEDPLIETAQKRLQALAPTSPASPAPQGAEDDAAQDQDSDQRDRTEEIAKKSVKEGEKQSQKKQ